MASPRLITREAIEIELGSLAAETWPARYKSHKYWGRKPPNVVGRYVEFFSRPGEVILDPFAGSGVTIIEGARLERAAIGFDLNPLAVRLTSAMLRPPRPEAFEAAALTVMAKAHLAVADLFLTSCDACGAKARVRSIGYVGDALREVRYQCDACRHRGVHAPTGEDIALAKRAISVPEDAPDEDIFFGWEMQKLKRRGVRRWRDLFTPRNLCAAAALRRAILGVDDASCREWLFLTLTASLAQFTRMIADSSGGAGGPSWKINCYWLPEKWQELNPLWYFENRVAKSIEAISELLSLGAPFPFGRSERNDSRRMPLDDESIDYIFTDPPYGGEGIQYGELSLLWCLWLGDKAELEAEIAYNPYRKLDRAHYESGLRSAFRECFRVLKKGRFMTVTFANKDPAVWDALMGACHGAGFSLVTAAPMKRSAPSLTETTMHTAPKADLVLTFVKPAGHKAALVGHSASYSLEATVRRIFTAMPKDGATITAHDIFDRVTVDWFSWFYEGGERSSAVQPTLANVEAAMRALGLGPEDEGRP